MKRKTSFLTIGGPVAAWCLLGIMVSQASCPSQARHPHPPVENGTVVITTASLPLEIPQFYSYRVPGGHVDFFVIRMHDRILSFLDACITCYPRKLGYRHEGGSVVCRACDTRYSIFKLESGLGGCYPIRIDGRSKSGAYVIARDVLVRHAGKF